MIKPTDEAMILAAQKLYLSLDAMDGVSGTQAITTALAQTEVAGFRRGVVAAAHQIEGTGNLAYSAFIRSLLSRTDP